MTIESMLDRVIAQGNRGHVGFRRASWITCADGFTLSVIAGGGAYCTPRPALCMCAVGGDALSPSPIFGEVAHDYPGPYDCVEVGFPSEVPEPWADWAPHAENLEKPTDTVYEYVPVAMVRELVARHGGEAVAE